MLFWMAMLGMVNHGLHIDSKTTTAHFVHTGSSQSSTFQVADGPDEIPPALRIVKDGPDEIPPAAFQVADGPDEIPPALRIVKDGPDEIPPAFVQAA